MELLPIIRFFWRRRLAVAIGVALAVTLGLISRGEVSSNGFASTRLVLDTPVSQFVAAAPSGGESLGWRSDILANLLTTDAIRQEIARTSGIAPEQLAVVSASLSIPALPTTLPRRASGAAARTSAPYLVTASANGDYPLVSFDARAPTRAEAVRLVASATTALRRAATPPPNMPNMQPLVVEAPGSIQSSQEATGRVVRMAAVTVTVLVLWCLGVLVLAPAALTTARRLAQRTRHA